MGKLASRKITITLAVFYLAMLAGIILFKTKISFAFLHMKFVFADADVSRSINLVPFGGMLILNGRLSYAEVVYNTLVFVPFGIFLCMLARRKTVISLFAPIVLTSLFFEVAQYIFVLGASDITDVIANTVGGVAGVGIFFIFRAVCKDKTDRVINAVALVLAAGFMLLLSGVRPL